MTAAQLQLLAGNDGIKATATPGSPTELIRAIQALRNDEPCFCTGKRHDCSENCAWRQDCRKPGAVWLR